MKALGFYFSNLHQGHGAEAGQIEVSPNRAGGAPLVIPVYLSLQRPLVSEVTGYSATSYIDIFSPQLAQRMRSGGHDGLIVRGEGGTEVFVALRPGQVKSAIGNNGLYARRSGSLTDRAPDPPARGSAADSAITAGSAACRAEAARRFAAEAERAKTRPR